MKYYQERCEIGSKNLSSGLKHVAVNYASNTVSKYIGSIVEEFLRILKSTNFC